MLRASCLLLGSAIALTASLVGGCGGDGAEGPDYSTEGVSPNQLCFEADDVPRGFVPSGGRAVQLTNQQRVEYAGDATQQQRTEAVTKLDESGRVTGYHCEWAHWELVNKPPGDDRERTGFADSPVAVVNTYVDVYGTAAEAGAAYANEASSTRSATLSTDDSGNQLPSYQVRRLHLDVGAESAAAGLAHDSEGPLLGWVGVFRMRNVVVTLNVGATCLYGEGSCQGLESRARELADTLEAKIDRELSPR